MNRLEWVRTIKERDNYTCVQCGSQKNIEAHHIIPQSENPELKYELSNGITLCKKCHLVLHAKTRKKGGTTVSDEKKRKTTTSTEVKNRYLKKHMTK